MSDASGGPRGIPISRALLLPPGPFGEALRPAVEAIDRVHGDGVLAPITIEVDPSLTDESRNEYISPLGDPFRIAIRPSGIHHALKLVHEIGHFLDHHGIGVAGAYESVAGPRLARWRAEVETSRAKNDLNAAVRRTSRVSSRDYLEYLLGYDELWARSYEQYVVLASGDTLLRRQLTAARKPPFWSRNVPELWTDQEFEPLGQAVEDVLRGLQWRK